jgi:hypothetical protein
MYCQHYDLEKCLFICVFQQKTTALVSNVTTEDVSNYSLPKHFVAYRVLSVCDLFYDDVNSSV